MKSFASFLTIFFLCFTLTSTRTHAVVGWIVKSSTVKSIGGVVTAGGVGFAFIGSRTASDGWVALGNLLGGLMVAGLGLIILDDQQEAEAQFTPLSKDYPLFTEDEISTYNNEIDELNAIHQTVTHELELDPKARANDLWTKYGDVLTPSTLKIAAYNGERLLRSMESL